MRVLLFILAILAFLAGFSMVFASKSAMQETVGMLVILAGAVFLTGAGIVDAILQMQKKIIEELRSGDSEN